jgi:putative transposase
MRAAQEMDCEILAINGMPDHVHLLLKTGAVVDMPNIMKKIKGNSSALLNRMMGEQERFRWQEGYYAASVTPSHVPKIAAYIHGQKEHHAAGTTHAFWERVEEDEE